MSSEVKKEIRLEIGHVLFIDIIGYSKLLITEQSEQMQQLREIVRGTEQFRLAEAEGKLLRLPTGDGGALVFRTNPEAPVLCALEISKELKRHPELRVRMGIHSGPVNEITDLNEQANIAGAGINVAQRVMDCGDAGHILLSQHVAEDLEQYPRWRSLLHDLGECEVKHGERVHVVNLYTEELGNPEVPEKFKQAAGAREAAATPVSKPVERPTAGRWAMIGAVLLITAAVVTGLLIFLAKRAPKLAPITSAAVPEKSIAVLPFENLSHDPDNAYFADGIQDEILARLSKIADLKVISRTSTQKYKSAPDNLREIARQLGVSNILEGSVQKAADQVRVNVQLINALTDAHLWSDIYDRKLTDIFAVESDIANTIADTLQAKLSPSQSDALATAPTRDAEAYDLFLKGEYEERQAEGALNAEPFDRAQTFYRQALARDPNFALAYARLAYSELNQFWFVTPSSYLTSAELAEIKANIDRALAIAPASPDAHLALAVFHYWGHRDYDAGLKELDRLLELQPNSSLSHSYRAAIFRRRGEWKRALAEFDRAAELDPRDSLYPMEIGNTYLILRRWSDAEHELTHALALDPHYVPAAVFLARTYINSTGDIRRARQILEGVPIESSIAGSSITGMVGDKLYPGVLEKHFLDALKAWDTAPANTPEARLRQLEARVAIQVLAGQGAVAKPECEQTRALLEARLAERPQDRDSLMPLAGAYVCLGRNADAVRVARQAADLLPIEKDAFGGAYYLAALAEIEARTGQAKEAIKILRRLITAPAGQLVSVARLKVDPVWDPIRNDPDFQKLISEPELETVYK